MTRQVKVTAAQERAAKAVVSRGAKNGRSVSSSVTKIAEAKPHPGSSATRAPA